MSSKIGLSQDKSVQTTKKESSAKWFAVSRKMGDGRRLSVQQRLQIAVDAIPRAQWQSFFGRSEKQLKRYLDGSDVPLSVLTIIAVKTGVAAEWLVSGRPTIDGADQVPSPLEEPGPSKRSRPGSVAEGSRQAITQFIEQQREDRNGRKYIVQTIRETIPSLTGYVAVSRENASHSKDPELVDHVQVTEDLAFRKDFLRTNEELDVDELLLVKARGERMKPLIPDGTILTVNLAAQNPEDGKVFVFLIGNSLEVKRLAIRADNSLMLLSENPLYPPEAIEHGRFAELVLGRVEFLLVSLNRAL